jgi:peptidoglycan/LPS O-acetylase OafA/YrhL
VETAGEPLPGNRAAETQSIPSGGRIVAIDIVRGFAILWVILYHLWSDVRFPHISPIPDTLRAVPHRIADGHPYAALTALTDACFRLGFLGVPLFMVLSGLSLTLVALRREQTARETPAFLYRRLRRVMIPYWFGFVYTVAFALALALVEWQRHDTDSYGWFVRHGDVPINRDQLLAGLLVVPRYWSNTLRFAPEGSLWFVLLIVQYYLLFPVLLPVLKRTGPWIFLLLAFGVTFASLNLIVSADGNLVQADSWVQTLAPFRIFEFALGMAGGYLIVHRPARLRLWAGSPLAVAGLVTAGLLVFVAANLIDEYGGNPVSLQAPMIALGMSLVFLPLVCKTPGRLEAGAAGRLLAWVGVMSYTVLIVNEPLRSVTHTLRVEHAWFGWKALWIGVLYMPITLLAARPLAVFLGLVEGSPRDRAAPAGPKGSTGGTAA